MGWPEWRNGRRIRLKIGRPQGRVGSTPTFGTMAKRLWAIRIKTGNEDRGWVVDHGRVVAVYEDKDYAEREAKWLSDFQRKCGSNNHYEAAKWPHEDGVEVAVQEPPTRRRVVEEMPKMTGAAPAPTIPTDLSSLLVAE